MKDIKGVQLGLKQPVVFKKIKIVKHVSYNKSYWLKHRQFFFKYSKEFSKDTGIMLGEVFVSRLCKELGVKCVDYHYAINLHKNSEHRGVISKNFLQKNEKSITLRQIREDEILSKYPSKLYLQMMLIYMRVSPIATVSRYKDLHVIARNLVIKYEEGCKLLLPIDKAFIKKNFDILQEIRDETRTEKYLTIDECERRIILFANKHNLFVDPNIRTDLQKIAILDAITKQVDRHSGNISIVYNKKEKTLKLAPMYDNGMCGYYGINSPSVDYPNLVNCYLKLTERDCNEINSQSTEISKFYKKVENFYYHGLDGFLKETQEQMSVMDSFRTKYLDEKYGKLYRRERSDYYWEMAKTNYKKGLDYLNRQISSSKSHKVVVYKKENQKTC